MSLPKWREEPISRQHDRTRFDCGDAALNDFLRQHARQTHDRGVAKTFLAVHEAAILGFYSLSPALIDSAAAPDSLRRGIGRYQIPGFRLGRLAVDRTMQGQGLGGQLLLASARRCILAATEVGGTVLLIDAKNPRVAAWYATWGALPLIDAPLSLVLPLATAAVALRDAGKL